MKKTVKVLIIVLLLLTVLFLFRELDEALSKNNTTTNNTTQTNLTANTSAYPIVVVHGWLGKAVDFTDYQVKLQKDGIAEFKGSIYRHSNMSICPEKWPMDVSVSAEYYYSDNRDKGIETYASELKPVIDLVMNCTGSDRVIIIAHSMGGLVSRKYMADYGNEHVKKLITLATPHYGFNEFTRPEIIFMMLDLFTGRQYEVEQMRPESDFLKALDKADADYRDKIVSIGTYVVSNNTLVFDLHIIPKEIRDFEKQNFLNTDLIVRLDSTKLAGAKYYQVEGCSHTAVTDWRVRSEKGPIYDPKKCPDAYNIVKDEIFNADNENKSIS